MPVSREINRSRPRRRAPPPASTMPLSMMSADSSGGVSSSVSLTVSTMALIGSEMASRTCSEVMTVLRGRPVMRSRPRISMKVSCSSRSADPMVILQSSAMRSPMSRLKAERA